MSKYDFKEVKDNADIVSIIGQTVALKKDGPQWKGRCPFHDEKSASFKVDPKKKTFKCYGCGERGDVVDFLLKHGNTYAEAIEICKGNSLSLGAPTINHVKKTIPAITWTQAIPEHQPTSFHHYRLGEPVKVWPRRNEEGIIISYDCRFEYEEEGRTKKDVLPFTYCTDGKRSEWRWKALDAPRPLYNIERIKPAPVSRAILVVEGMKTLEAAERLIAKDKSIVTTWQGGGKAVELTDWSILHDRLVTIWQDNDYAGYETTQLIVRLLQPYNCKIKFVHNDPAFEKGWDLWDGEAAGWDMKQVKKYINSNTHDFPQEIANDKLKQIPNDTNDGNKTNGSGQNDEGNQQGQDAIAPVIAEQPATVLEIEAPQATPTIIPLGLPGEKPATGDDNKKNNKPRKASNNPPDSTRDEDANAANNPFFRFLGFVANDGKLHYCFYNNSNKTIIKLSASGMGKPANLIELAPLQYWQRYFPNRRESVDHAAAVNMLIGYSNKVGIFRPNKIRGRGAWTEGKDIVIHSGDALLHNGVLTDLGSYRGNFIYEQAAPLEYHVNNPIDIAEASRLLELTKMLKWERDVNAYLLAGWCVIAPICGALKWRPHGWITGPAGCGKTWVLQQIIKPLLGNVALFVQGSTSEAGLRQALKRDALPVIFDEAEGEDKNAQDRMQAVLTLMRSASAEDGGNIIKGSSGGSADAYQIRSCFMYASIGMQLSQQSDRTRVTTLGMRAYADQSERGKHFERLMEVHSTLMNDEFPQRLQARTIKMLPVILENAKVFSAAAAAVLGQQRLGDQLGALLAGAYSLVSNHVITYDKAVEWVKQRDWEEEEELTETKDERVLFQHIMGSMVDVEGQFTKLSRPVGELIRHLYQFDDPDPKLTEYMINVALMRSGIRTERQDEKSMAYILISSKSNGIKRLLKDTPWNKSFFSLLGRIPGSYKKSARFGDGMVSRAVAIPVSYFVE